MAASRNSAPQRASSARPVRRFSLEQANSALPLVRRKLESRVRVREVEMSLPAESDSDVSVSLGPGPELELLLITTTSTFFISAPY